MSTTTRTPSRARYAIGAVLIAITLIGCGTTTPQAMPAPATAGEDAVLGPMNRATGAPVKIGWLGKGLGSDPSDGTLAAVAVAGYANTYLGGLVDHQIQVVACEDLGTEAGGRACGERFVNEGVVAVAVASSGQIDSVVSVVTAADIPVVVNLAGTELVMRTPGVFLLRNPLSVFGTPAAYARDNALRSVVILTPDVPAASGPARSLAPALFANVGATVSVVSIALGASAMLPQIAEARRGRPDMWLVVGDTTFCTAALGAIRSSGSTARIVAMDHCVGSGGSALIPGGYDGIDVVAQAVVNPDQEDYALFTAVRDVYGDGVEINSESIGGYQTMLSLVEAVNAMAPAELTAASTAVALRQSPAIRYPLGGGATFRCDGQAVPQVSPNICTSDGLLAKADADGTLIDAQLVDTTGIYQLDRP
jgi:ABC-type branched-subunit amino acid transport system substrate-binding protein